MVDEVPVTPVSCCVACPVDKNTVIYMFLHDCVPDGSLSLTLRDFFSGVSVGTVPGMFASVICVERWLALDGGRVGAVLMAREELPS